MDWVTFAAIAALPLALLQVVELSVGVMNARRGARLEARADRAEAKIDDLIARLELGAAEAEKISSGMRGGVDPRELVESREAKADQAARVELEILSQAVEHFGERFGPALIEWVRVNAPGPWKRALKNPAMSNAILEPAFRLGAKMIGAQRASSNTNGAPQGGGAEYV